MLCDAHYKRWRRHGDLQLHKPIHGYYREKPCEQSSSRSEF
jgi:hypothetical protein